MATIIGQTAKPYGRPAYRYIRSTDRLPTVDEARAQVDPLLRVKLFCPTATWWIAGYDPETGRAFGVAQIFEREEGDFDLNEIVALRTPPFGLPVERDLYWDPVPLSEVAGV